MFLLNKKMLEKLKFLWKPVWKKHTIYLSFRKRYNATIKPLVWNGIQVNLFNNTKINLLEKINQNYKMIYPFAQKIVKQKLLHF